MGKGKFVKYLEIALLVISLIVFVLAVTGVTTVDSPMLNVYLGWAYALIAVTLVFTLGFPLVRAFKSKKSIFKLIGLIAAVVVICGGAYLIAPGNAVSVNTEATAADFKFADAVIFVTYLFIAAAFVALVWGGVRKIVKK